MPESGWKEHTLIQALLSRGPLKKDQFHMIFDEVTGKNPDAHQRLFNDYLLRINKGLSFAQFELRGCSNQYDGQTYYGIVNNVSDENSKLGTKYSVPQIAFYNAIIEAIVHDASAQGSISNIDALHLQLEHQTSTEAGSQSQNNQSLGPAAFRNFSISNKEKTLHDLVEDQWLASTPEGFIKLGVRTFLDLRSWFRSKDIPSCEVCNEAGVKAELCPNEACAARVHQYCLQKILSERKGKRSCPSCGTQWNCTIPIAEAVEEQENQPDSGSKRANYNNALADADAAATASVPSSKTSSDHCTIPIAEAVEEQENQPDSGFKRKRRRANYNNAVADEDAAATSLVPSSQTSSD